jgi:two-component system, NtrC family, response regulator AtoC
LDTPAAIAPCASRRNENGSGGPATSRSFFILSPHLKETFTVAENMTETARLLVVSRESAVLRPLWSMAESHSWHVESVVSAWDAMERVQSGVVPHLLLLDLPRGDGDTLHILRWLRRLRPDLPVIVMCFPEDAERKREATRMGAQEVLVRPIDEAVLQSAISRYLVAPENGHAEIDSQDIEQLGPDAFFVSAGPTAQKLRAQVELLAEADVPVLILGETGSGKDTVARLIHKHSVRSGFKFLKVNCADMPAQLLEAELFGNEGLARLGAARTQSGKFERAEKGTILLDEISQMPLDLQARLMQVLQDKLLPRTGTDKAGSVDVRILASTSADLARALAERKLREDLYYRLSAFTVQVPPLRQRRSEIVVLMRHLMHKLAKHYVIPPREFSASVLDACQRYSWPGNLSELESFVKRYLVSGDGELAFGEFESQFTPVRRATSTTATLHSAASEPEGHSNGSRSLKSLIQSVKGEAERTAIGSALQKTGWNRKAAARLLQVSYRTLLYKIDQYHMSASEPALPPYHGARFSLQDGTVKSNGKG